MIIINKIYYIPTCTLQGDSSSWVIYCVYTYIYIYIDEIGYEILSYNRNGTNYCKKKRKEKEIVHSNE